MVLMSVAAVSAFGDQCAWVPETVVQKALPHVAKGATVLQYCEPCGDAEPKPLVVSSVEMRRVEGQDYFELAINGAGEDLAYLFVKKDGTTFRNLGKIADCGATGVSLKVDYPATQGTEKLWRSRYERSQASATLHVYQENRGPTLQIRFNRISESQGDRRAELQGSAEMESGRVVFSTPFSGCDLLIDRGKGSVKVSPRGNCGAMGTTLAGDYTEKGSKL